MLESHPVRRDPRLLVVLVGLRVIRYAALDAWEVRALGVLPPSRTILPLALWRLVVRTHPSHVLLATAGGARLLPYARHLRRLALERGLPYGALDPGEIRGLEARAPAYEAILAAYPELRHLAEGPRDGALRPLRIALGVLLTRSLPPRHYVPGLTPRPAPRVAP